jgi:purine-binding chemotaxis protein CheW
MWLRCMQYTPLTANQMNPANANDPAQGQSTSEQFVVFYLDNEAYAVPILSVTEVVPTLEITPVPNSPAYILGLINLRGKVLPVLDLEKKFQLPRETQAVHQHIMVAESEQKILFGVLVDKVKEVLRIPSDTIKPPPEIIKSKISAEYLQGVIIVEDKLQDTNDNIILILDLQKILSDRNIEELPVAQPAPPDNHQDVVPTIDNQKEQE